MFHIVLENKLYLDFGRCHPYCFFAEASSKNTGMHPAIMELNVDRRVGVSPGGWRQNLDFNIGTIERIGSWVQAPAEQSTRVHISVRLAH